MTDEPAGRAIDAGQMEELQEFFETLLRKVEEEGLTREDREMFLKLAVTVATNELYRIESEHAPDEGMIVDPRIMMLLRQIGVLLQKGDEAKMSEILNPDGEPFKHGPEEGLDEG